MTGVDVLAVGNVVDPLAVEGLGVQGVHHGVAGQLTVAGVAPALQMGAVGGDTGVEIAQLGVQVSVIQPVQRLVVTGKIGGDVHAAVDRQNTLRHRRADDLQIAEGKPGKHGPDLPPGPVTDEGHMLAMMEGHVRGAVRVPLFGAPNRHGFAGLAGQRQHRQAGAVASGVVADGVPVPVQFGDGQQRLQTVGGAACEQVVGNHRRGGPGVGPAAVVKIGAKAPVVKAGEVLILMGIEIVGLDIAVADPVVFGGDNFGHTPVRFHCQPENRLGAAVGRMIWAPVAAVVGIPAAAEMDGQYVLTLPQQIRHLVFRHIDPAAGLDLVFGIVFPGFVVGGQGEKFVVRHGLAVEIRVEKAKAQHPQPGGTDAGKPEGTAENGEQRKTTGIRRPGGLTGIGPGPDPKGRGKYFGLLHGNAPFLKVPPLYHSLHKKKRQNIKIIEKLPKNAETCECSARRTIKQEAHLAEFLRQDVLPCFIFAKSGV